MDRRAFLAGAVGVFAPLIAAAQLQRRTWRIGYLGGSEQGNPLPEILREGMRNPDYVEGRDYVVEFRWGRGDPKLSVALATELVGLKVDVIITAGSEATRAAKQVTSSIPIVFVGPSYPVEEGLVASFARPGGNITGITVAMSDTVSKHLQLLRELVPTLADVAMIWSPANPGNTFAFRDTESAAASNNPRGYPDNSTRIWRVRERKAQKTFRMKTTYCAIRLSSVDFSARCIGPRNGPFGVPESRRDSLLSYRGDTGLSAGFGHTHGRTSILPNTSSSPFTFARATISSPSLINSRVSRSMFGR
ncbi:MAG: ABC transporter substrate-binding protein [Gemmatimonadaceae bacterium]